MSSYHIDFVTFHRTGERDLRRPIHDAFTQLGCHLPGIIRIEIEFLGNLFIREIQSLEGHAENPDTQRLVVTGKDGPDQIVEASLTGGAGIPLAGR